MPVAIFTFAILGGLIGPAAALVLGAGIGWSLAMAPVSGSAAALALCALVAVRSDESKPQPVRGSNSEPECIPAP